MEVKKEKLVKHTSMYKTVNRKRVGVGEQRFEDADLLFRLGNSTSLIGQCLDVLLKVV